MFQRIMLILIMTESEQEAYHKVNMGNNISNPRSRHLTTPTPMICLTKTMTVPKILLMEYQKKKMRVKIQKQWIHEIINMINSTQANDGKNLTFNFYHL